LDKVVLKVHNITEKLLHEFKTPNGINFAHYQGQYAMSLLGHTNFFEKIKTIKMIMAPSSKHSDKGVFSGSDEESVRPN